MKIKDIHDNELSVGDEVYYARSRFQNSILITGIITKITKAGNVKIDDKFLARRPNHQIAKR